MKRWLLAALCLLAAPAIASRNSAGTYSLPTGNPVVTGTSISSSWANNTLSDISTELTNSLDRSGRGAMLAPLQLSNGQSGAPALTFSAEPGSGLYRAGSNDIRLQCSASQVQQWTSTGTTVIGLTSTGGVTSTGPSAGGNGLTSTGVGTGAGVSGTGGATSGVGGTFAGGAPNGIGVFGGGSGTGPGGQFSSGASDGVQAFAGGSGSGVNGFGGSTSGNGGFFHGGTPNGVGLTGAGAGTGAGVTGAGGSTSGTGGNFAAGGPNGVGIISTGAGTGAGANIAGGSNANGLNAFAGSGGGFTGVVGTGGPSGAGLAGFAGTAATTTSPQLGVVAGNGFFGFNSAPNLTATTAAANMVTPKNIVKAWAKVRTNGSGGITLVDGYNISSATLTGPGEIVVTMATAMANTNYGVFLSGSAGSGLSVLTQLVEVDNVRTSSAFTVDGYAAGSASVINFNSTAAQFSAMVIGAQ